MRPLLKLPPRPVCALLFAILLTACGAAPTAIERIQIVAETGANQNSATAIDIVFAYDSTAAGMLPKTGPDWFAAKPALLNGLASAVDVVSWELPPGKVIDVSLPARHRGAIAVYSYVNHIDQAGQALGNLTPYRGMTIRLKPNTVAYTGN